MTHFEKNCSVKITLPWAEYEAMEGTKEEWAGVSARLVLMSSLRSCYFFLSLLFFPPLGCMSNHLAWEDFRVATLT